MSEQTPIPKEKKSKKGKSKEDNSMWLWAAAGIAGIYFLTRRSAAGLNNTQRLTQNVPPGVPQVMGQPVGSMVAPMTVSSDVSLQPDSALGVPGGLGSSSIVNLSGQGWMV